ncbi:hypothetical protein LBMAG42_12400 [Deltaproteobacteria bacterium]|nr:hypothetical protein LBMAG42_12400 [Deltaproteobacteria bacterium]
MGRFSTSKARSTIPNKTTNGTSPTSKDSISGRPRATDVPRLSAKAIGSGSTWRTTDYVYDALGRLAEAEIDDGGEVVTQTWSNRDVYGRPRAQSRAINGAVESSSTFATDLRGRITDVSLFTPTRTGQAAYQYTANGELAVVQSRWASGGSWGATRGLQYDHAGPEGELTGIKDYSSGSTYASVASRDVLGRATEIELQGGALVQQQFDLMGRLDWRRATKGGGDWRLQDYSYDNRGRVDGVVASSSTGVGSTTSFTYDEPGWLTQELHTDASGTRTIDYGYDVAGNRLSRLETVGTTTTSRAFTYGYGNVLATVDGSSVSWNAFGETTTDHRGADIDRAGDGAEVGVTDSAGLPLYGFTRGPGGEAVELEESASGDLRSFLWGPAEADFPVSTLDESGTDQAYVSIEGMVVGRLDGGSFVPMAQTAQGGMLLDGSDFLDAGLAFGEESAVASGSPERRVWALLESLPGTAYKLPRRRLYDEDTGRFASQDPIGLAGGDHRFAYLNGDPMGGVDPSGLMGVRGFTPGARVGGPLAWDPTTTGKSMPAWMRSASGNTIPALFRNDTPGCAPNDPFCIRADGEPPPETEEAQGEVDAGAEGWTTDENGVEWRPGDEGMEVLVTPDEPPEEAGGGVMWSEAGNDPANDEDGETDFSSPTWGLDAAAAGNDWASGVEIGSGGGTAVRTPTAREQALCATLDDPLSRKLTLGYSMRQGRPLKLTPGELAHLAYVPESNKVRLAIDEQLGRGFTEIRNHQPGGGALGVGGALDTDSGATTNKTGIQIEGDASSGRDGRLDAFRGKFRVYDSLDFDNFSTDQPGGRDDLTRLGFALMYPYGQPYMVTSDWYPLTIDAGGWRTTMPGFGVGGNPVAGTSQMAEMAGVIFPVSDGVAGAVGGAKFGGGRGGLNAGDVGALAGGTLAFGIVSAAGQECAVAEYAAHQPGGAYGP